MSRNSTDIVLGCLVIVALVLIFAVPVAFIVMLLWNFIAEQMEWRQINFLVAYAIALLFNLLTGSRYD